MFSPFSFGGNQLDERPFRIIQREQSEIEACSIPSVDFVD